MTDLPDMPEAYRDGGPARSSAAPGDPTRELLHEVRNLATSVQLLKAVLIRRSRAALLTGVIGSLLLLATLGGFGFVIAQERSQAQALRMQTFDNCMARNAETREGGNTFGKLTLLISRLNAIDKRNGLTPDETDRVAAYDEFLLALASPSTEPLPDCNDLLRK